jgi:Skp family chaperone for outer membrane proteins
MDVAGGGEAALAVLLLRWGIAVAALAVGVWALVRANRVASQKVTLPDAIRSEVAEHAGHVTAMRAQLAALMAEVESHLKSDRAREQRAVQREAKEAAGETPAEAKRPASAVPMKPPDWLMR